MKNLQGFNSKTLKLFIIHITLTGCYSLILPSAQSQQTSQINKDVNSGGEISTTNYDFLNNNNDDNLFMMHFPDDQITTNNPCLVHYCSKGRECLIDEKGLPTCVCQRNCPYRNKPICGTDGMVYENHCELHRAACILNRPIALQKLDKCATISKKKKTYYSNREKLLSTTKKTTTTTTTTATTTITPFIDGIEYQTTPATPPPTTLNKQSLSTKEINRFHRLNEISDDEDDDNGDDYGGGGGVDNDNQNNNNNNNNNDDDISNLNSKKGYCSQQEYEIMKDNLLLYSHTKMMKQENNHSKDFLVSIMFAHYDQNHNNQLEENELNKISIAEHLDDLSNGCALKDMLVFDDNNNDRTLSINEFYQAFNKMYSLSVVSLDKALETNHLSARVDDNVEIKCDVTGSPLPPIIWKRYSTDLMTLGEDEIRVYNDGSLYLTKIQLINGGNYSCHAERNKDVMQTHILSVHTSPDVRVIPRLQSRRPGESCEMFCHVTGEPFPIVEWLKNDEPLHMAIPKKYEIIGNGTSLKIHNISYADTGAYMCQATNIGGTVKDISSLIVEQEPTPTVMDYGEQAFFVFHEYGIAIYEPSTCRLHHQIHGTDIIPGTQLLVCGDKSLACSWGRAINVGQHYIYVSQPLFDRILVISTVQIVVIDVISTDKYPVNLYYVPHLDHVWVLNWRSTYDTDSKTIQVIRDAKQKIKHQTVHPEPIDGQFDLVKDLFLPPSDIERYPSVYKYGYVTHHNQRGIYKLDLINFRYIKSVDLAAYNCVPESIDFSSLYGYVILSCREPVTGRHQGQLLLDYLTDTVLSSKPIIMGIPKISPDSRHIATIDHRSDGVTLVIQKILPSGLEFLFDVKTTLNISELAFYESQTMHGYDLFASSSDKENILYINLYSGKVEMITSVGQPISRTVWNNPIRPIRSSGLFGRYMVTPARNAIFVINGKSRTVNCEIGGVSLPFEVIWTEHTTNQNKNNNNIFIKNEKQN